MDKPEKEVKSKGEIRRFFNTKVVKSEKVVIGGKTMYMTIDKIDDSGKEVERKKNTKSKIREKQREMNQTLNFPDDIDYQKSGDILLYKNIIKDTSSEKEKKKDKVNESVQFMITLLDNLGFKNPKKSF